MAKKSQTPQPPKDAFHRMNFLLQAATLYPESCLSNHFVRQAKLVSQKMVLRMDPSLKRTLCKCCDATLIPGLTCLVTFNKGKVVWTCKTCSRTKQFPLDKEKVTFAGLPAEDPKLSGKKKQ